MKISINIDEKIQDTEIVVNSNHFTPEIEKIVEMLRLLDSQMTVTKGEESCLIDVDKIVYVESVDRKTFIYTEKDCYESGMKLYEMEERLCKSGFQRVSKGCLVHLKYIRSIKTELDRKLKLTMDSGEKIIVSRQYSDELKQRLGVK